MKATIKKYLIYSSLFVCGLIIGIVAIGYLSARASRTFLEVFRSTYYYEQIRLAANAHRDRNKYAEFVHRSNVVDSSPSGKLTVFNEMKGAWSFGFPFAAPILDCIAAPPELEKGRKMSYAIELGRLAETTEEIGLKDDADRLWNESAKLLGHNNVGRVRSLVAELHKVEVKAFGERPEE